MPADLYEVLEHATAHGWSLEEAQGDLEFALGDYLDQLEGAE